MNDLIDRQAAIDAVQKYKCEHGFDYYDCICDVERDLRSLPSVQPERKKGKWIPEYVYVEELACSWVKWKCSCCGYVRNTGWEYTSDGMMPKAHICENCGSEMIGRQNDDT